jgi:hypothetical protein
MKPPSRGEDRGIMNFVEYYTTATAAFVSFVMIVDIINSVRRYSRHEEPEGWRYAVTRYGIPLIAPLYFLGAVILFLQGAWGIGAVYVTIAVFWYVISSRNNDDSWKRLARRMAERVAVTSDGRLKVVRA